MLNEQTLKQICEALEIGADLAAAHADETHRAYAGYKPDRHAAVDRDVVTLREALALAERLRAAAAAPVVASALPLGIQEAVRLMVAGYNSGAGYYNEDSFAKGLEKLFIAAGVYLDVEADEYKLAAAPASPAAPVAQPADLTDEKLETLAARFGIGPAGGKMFGRAVLNAATPAAPLAQQSEPVAWQAGMQETPKPDALVKRSEWDDAKNKRQSFNGWRIDYDDCDMKLYTEETLVRHAAEERQNGRFEAAIEIGAKQGSERAKEWIAHVEQRSTAPLYAGSAPASPVPSDVSKRLRERATGGYTAVRQEDGELMIAAADEIERYYGGMLNWKRSAEAKDAAPASTGPCSDDTAKDAQCERCGGEEVIYVEEAFQPCPQCVDLSDYDDGDSAALSAAEHGGKA